MPVSDPIADLLTRIRNANSANHDSLEVSASNVKIEITKILFAQITGGALPGVDLVAFGVLLILCVAFAPRGVMGLAARTLIKPRRATS